MNSWPLALAGWDSRSSWGYDEGVGSFYALLTRNGDEDVEGSVLWLTPPTTPVIHSPEDLAALIATRTETLFADVLAAMRV